MPSRVEEFVTAVAARYADATVSFEAGALRVNEHGQQRRIIFARAQGALQFSTAPGRAAFGAPTGGAGTYTLQRFQREEQLEITIRAEDETALDAMFDRLVNSIFEVAGPNAFEDVNRYEWIGHDAQQGGTWASRQPAIRLYVNVRLASRSQPATYVQVQEVDASVQYPGATLTAEDGTPLVIEDGSAVRTIEPTPSFSVDIETT